MKLYITRHGETIWNKENRRQGWLNSNLSEKGVAETKLLGESLKDVPFSKIYSSPLGRAVETAELIRGERDIPIVLCDDLKEISFGKWEGMANDEIDELYGEENYNFWNRPHLFKTTEGESFEDVIERAERALKTIVEAELKNHGDGDSSNEPHILVVTHGVTKKALYKVIKNTSLEAFWGPPHMHNTCLSVLQVTPQQMEFILEADLSHLES